MDRTEITAELVSRLVASQYPQWAHLPVSPVELPGWDNVTFRLGEDKSVRLPSGPSYEAQVEKEHRWLPRLALQLPLPIPQPLAKGSPELGFPRVWSIYLWRPGRPAAPETISDQEQFAEELAAFLCALYGLDPTGGPPWGSHSFKRGGPVSVWDEQTRETVDLLGNEVGRASVLAVWDAAMSAERNQRDVWVHGDVTESNLLVDSTGRLSAVLDFGCSSVGDPACDLTVAWTLLRGSGRERFRAALGFDDATWARGRGWALWKALLGIRWALEEGGTLEARGPRTAGSREVIAEVLADHATAR